MNEHERPSIYIVPENFIDESRVLSGMFKTRNVVEGCVIAALLVLLLKEIPISTFSTRVSVLCTGGAAGLFLGVVGIGGDPLSTFLAAAIQWLCKRRVMLFNGNIRVRLVSPIEAVMGQELPQDKMIAAVDRWREARQNSGEQIQWIEGENFDFDNDDDLIQAERDIKYKRKKDIEKGEKKGKEESKQKKPRRNRSKKKRKAELVAEETTDAMRSAQDTDDFSACDDSAKSPLTEDIGKTEISLESEKSSTADDAPDEYAEREMSLADDASNDASDECAVAEINQPDEEAEIVDMTIIDEDIVMECELIEE